MTSNKPLSEFQCDLLTPPEYLKKDLDYKMILVVSDVVSKFVFYDFIRNKKEDEIKRAFGNIVKEL